MADFPSRTRRLQQNEFLKKPPLFMGLLSLLIGDQMTLRMPALLAVIIVLAAVPANAGECTFRPGDAAEFRSPMELVDELKKATVIKSEFETTAEFEQRQESAAADIEPRYLVWSDYDAKFAVYDADREAFDISRFAWSNTRGDFHNVFADVSVIDPIFGVGLHVESWETGSYLASNSFGAATTVVQRAQRRYGVFDRAGDTGAFMWDYDFPESGSYSDDTYRGPGVTMPVPRSVAPETKSGLMIGIEFGPRSPFLAEGKNRWEATLDRPEEVTEEILVLIGDIECLVIAGPSGEVLRTVSTAY